MWDHLDLCFDAELSFNVSSDHNGTKENDEDEKHAIITSSTRLDDLNW